MSVSICFFNLEGLYICMAEYMEEMEETPKRAGTR